MASALVPSPNYSTTSTFIKTASLSSQAYVLSIVLSASHITRQSASAPSNTIDLFDKTTLRGFGTTSLRSVDSIANISRPMTNLGQARGLLCCDVSQDGLTVAGGTQLQGEDAHIVYWDPRQPATPLRTHSSTHSDDVTVLSFSPDSPNILITSTADEDDEDEAVIHVGVWNTSVSQAGWSHSSSGAKIWASSDMETFSTWSDEDIRAPSLHNHAEHEWLTDYLITCHSTPTSDMKVFVGETLRLLTNSNLAAPAAPWSLRNTWTTGHTGIVRSLLWDDQNGVMVTGGEDGKINVWSCPPPQSEDSTMDVDSSSSRKRDKPDMDWEDEHRARR
ncbi:hypothetical protein DFH06DRAFT_1183066 [Mycena polygramma]|nr:hypothetical protein DFH06DRAFT_1183066 [Mycena polygramma]